MSFRAHSGRDPVPSQPQQRRGVDYDSDGNMAILPPLTPPLPSWQVFIQSFQSGFPPPETKVPKKKKKITFAKKINSYLEVLVGSWYLRERDFPGSLAGKESACNAGDPGSIPGSGRSPREGILELPWWLRQ